MNKFAVFQKSPGAVARRPRTRTNRPRCDAAPHLNYRHLGTTGQSDFSRLSSTEMEWKTQNNRFSRKTQPLGMGLTARGTGGIFSAGVSRPLRRFAVPFDSVPAVEARRPRNSGRSHT